MNKTNLLNLIIWLLSGGKGKGDKKVKKKRKFRPLFSLSGFSLTMALSKEW